VRDARMTAPAHDPSHRHKVASRVARFSGDSCMARTLQSAVPMKNQTKTTWLLKVAAASLLISACSDDGDDGPHMAVDGGVDSGQRELDAGVVSRPPDAGPDAAKDGAR
jgi:hypothetical protein